MFMLHQSKDIFRLWLLRRKVWHLRAESNNLAGYIGYIVFWQTQSQMKRLIRTLCILNKDIFSYEKNCTFNTFYIYLTHRQCIFCSYFKYISYYDKCPTMTYSKAPLWDNECIDQTQCRVSCPATPHVRVTVEVQSWLFNKYSYSFLFLKPQYTLEKRSTGAFLCRKYTVTDVP